jgi:DNA-directed RNA polymerase subunit beta'
LNIASESQILTKYDGELNFDNVRTIPREVIDEDSGDKKIVRVAAGRSGEVRVLESSSRNVIVTYNIPYGAIVDVNDGQKVKKGDVICTWDPYNAVIISDIDGTVEYEHIVEGVTVREEGDDLTGFFEKVVIETKDKTRNPMLRILGKEGNREYNLPVAAHINVKAGEKIKAGQILVKIPRQARSVRDITGGLPRVTELFEARNPSNPAVVCEIDGVVTYGGIKRGNREITVENKDGEVKRYLVSLSKHILVHDGDYVRAGAPLSDGAITPQDILQIEGSAAVQRYVLNGIQEVYRLQGVKINDKHIEVIVRQMLQKVEIANPGETTFLSGEQVDRDEFELVNAKTIAEGYKPATCLAVLQGITKASLQTRSFISAASFQETTRVLTEAAVYGKIDGLVGLKENVIVGRLIPAGTGASVARVKKLANGRDKEFEAQLAAAANENQTPEEPPALTGTGA